MARLTRSRGWLDRVAVLSEGIAMTVVDMTHSSTIPSADGYAAAGLIDRWVLSGIFHCCACISGGRVRR